MSAGMWDCGIMEYTTNIPPPTHTPTHTCTGEGLQESTCDCHVSREDELNYICVKVWGRNNYIVEWCLQRDPLQINRRSVRNRKFRQSWDGPGDHYRHGIQYLNHLPRRSSSFVTNSCVQYLVELVLLANRTFTYRQIHVLWVYSARAATRNEVGGETNGEKGGNPTTRSQTVV